MYCQSSWYSQLASAVVSTTAGVFALFLYSTESFLLYITQDLPEAYQLNELQSQVAAIQLSRQAARVSAEVVSLSVVAAAAMVSNVAFAPLTMYQ